MDKFPSELWVHLAKAASYNDVYTRRSLLLSCKYLNNVTQSVLPGNLAIQGSRQMVSFSRCLSLGKFNEWPIRNLHLETTPNYGTRNAKQLRASISLLEGRRPTTHKAAEQAMRFILFSFSSTVENLTISDINMDPNIFPRFAQFPRLVGLIIIARTSTIVDVKSLRGLYSKGLHGMGAIELKDLAPIQALFSDHEMGDSVHFLPTSKNDTLLLGQDAGDAFPFLGEMLALDQRSKVFLNIDEAGRGLHEMHLQWNSSLQTVPVIYSRLE